LFSLHEDIEVYFKNGPNYWCDKLISDLEDEYLVNIMVGYICRRLWHYRDDKDLKLTKSNIKNELRKRNLELKVKYELEKNYDRYIY
jgi:hypothetical protein